MKKLIEIMDESNLLNDDLTPSATSKGGPELSQSMNPSEDLLLSDRKDQPVLPSISQPRVIEMVAKNAQQPTARAGSARRGNTRYGDVEDSMINFDLTSSKIIDHEPLSEEGNKKQQYSSEENNADTHPRKSLKL